MQQTRVQKPLLVIQTSCDTMPSLSATEVRSPLTFNLTGFKPQFIDLASHTPRFNTLTATAEFLQNELSAGNLKSTEIVEEYHRSICKHNGYLNAVSELAPGAMKRAEELDRLRAEGTLLGPLHGIPILIKVCTAPFRYKLVYLQTTG